MEHLTAEGNAVPEIPAGAAIADPDLDRALASAIRRLILQAAQAPQSGLTATRSR